MIPMARHIHGAGGGGGGGPVSRSYVDSTGVVFPGSVASYTFSGAALGSSAGGQVLIGISWSYASNTITGVTADGNTLTQIASGGTGGSEQLYWFLGPCSASTGDIVVTCSAAAFVANACAFVYRVDGHSATAVDSIFATGNTQQAVDTDTVADGAAFILAYDYGTTDTAIVGLTDDDAESDGGSGGLEVASDLTSAAETRSVDVGFSAGYGLALTVSLGPA